MNKGRGWWGFDSFKYQEGEGERRSYNDHFWEELQIIFKVNSFEELVKKISKERGRPINVLDLFGGAYFLNDLSHVENLIGFRKEDIEEDLLKDQNNTDRLNALKSSDKHLVVTGDLFDLSDWRRLPASINYDLIVCRPEGPFRNRIVNPREGAELNFKPRFEDDTKSSAFLMLLKKALKRLEKGGVLVLQLPALELENEADVSSEWSPEMLEDLSVYLTSNGYNLNYLIGMEEEDIYAEYFLEEDEEPEKVLNLVITRNN